MIRAISDWILDNDFTPHLIVDADAEGAEVPRQYVEDGKVVLNISPTAVRALELGNDWIQFGARFDGAAFQVAVPVSAVMAVYARENGLGMAFKNDAPDSDPPDGTDEDGDTNRPVLRLVK